MRTFHLTKDVLGACDVQPSTFGVIFAHLLVAIKPVVEESVLKGQSRLNSNMLFPFIHIVLMNLKLIPSFLNHEAPHPDHLIIPLL
jgi:hypothetical protein